MKKNKIVNLLCPTAFLLFGAWVFMACASMSRGNRMFPQIVAVLTVLIAVVGIINVLCDENTKPVFSSDVNYAKLATCVLSICVYIFLMKKIGFYIDTLFLTSFNTWNMGYRRYHMIAMSSVLITTVVFFTFYFLIKAPLPTLFL